MCCRGKSDNDQLVSIKVMHHHPTMDQMSLVLKMTLIGDSGVGKSQLLNRLVDGTFSSHEGATIGVDFKSLNLSVNDKTVKIMLWDTAGQERFRAVTQSYYRATHAILVVFDLTKQHTLESVHQWIEEAKKAAPDALIIIVGSKLDLVNEDTPKVDVSQLDTLLGRDDSYVEASSRTGVGIKELTMVLGHAARRVMLRENERAHQRMVRSNQAILARYPAVRETTPITARVFNMELDGAPKNWEEICDREDVREIYSDGASNAAALPWEVRSALGDFLCEEELDDSKSPQQKSAFLSKITDQLTKSGNSIAQEQWSLFTGLKVKDGNGVSKKHTKTSLYGVVKRCVDAERKLVEGYDEDLEQFLDDGDDSFVSFVEEPVPIKQTKTPKYVMDEDDIDPAFFRKRGVPECAVNLFKTLESLT